MKTLPADNIYVYVGKTADWVKDAPLFPPLRQAEINACASEQKRKEKYAVWSLLTHALQDGYGVDVRDLVFTKGGNGKWGVDGYAFSLSHAGDVVAVAVATSLVGVDVEKATAKMLRVEKQLIDVDDSTYAHLDECAKVRALTKVWTQKESTFKVQGQGIFRPRSVENAAFTRTRWAHVDGETYAVSVACAHVQDVRWTALGGVGIKECEQDV